MSRFATIVNGFEPLTIVTKLSIFEVCEGPSYASGTLRRYCVFKCKYCTYKEWPWVKDTCRKHNTDIRSPLSACKIYSQEGCLGNSWISYIRSFLQLLYFPIFFFFNIIDIGGNNVKNVLWNKKIQGLNM